jgi:Fe-S oxidoreductase
MQDTYRDLLPDESESRMARLEAATSVEAYLQERLDFRGAMGPSVQLLLFHPHCHERAATPAGEHRDRFAGMGLLRACGYSVELVDAGCCGMGGTFGYEAEHYDLSQRIGELALFPAIRAAPGSAVAATGGSCRLQIQQATGAEARHPLVWAARALVPSG